MTKRFQIVQLEERIAPAVADVTNIADTIHPNIHQNVGDGTNANPFGGEGGRGNADGNGIHGIANVPGQGGGTPQTGGFASNLETVHGGIGAVNPNAAAN